MIMEMNELTKKLLAEGYSKENPPPEYRQWNDFYGGWEYTHNQKCNIVCETPCGLLMHGERAISMGYAGIDWCLENNNAIITCPFDRLHCEKNHEALRDKKFVDGFVQCSVHISDKEYDYEKSLEKEADQENLRIEELYHEFVKKRNGRVCRRHSHYDRENGCWRFFFSPENCKGVCSYCSVLQKNLSNKKGNVFYDLKTTTMTEADGLFTPEKIISIKKGVKFFDKNISIDFCEIFAKSFKYKIENKEKMKHSKEYFFAEYHDKFFELEVLNVRAETRCSRDLEQDMKDIGEGISVYHVSDEEKAAEQVKRENRQKAVEQRIRKMHKLIAANGITSILNNNEYSYKLRRMCDKGIITDKMLDLWQAEFKNKDKNQQLTLF